MSLMWTHSPTWTTSPWWHGPKRTGRTLRRWCLSRDNVVTQSSLGTHLSQMDSTRISCWATVQIASVLAPLKRFTTCWPRVPLQCCVKVSRRWCCRLLWVWLYTYSVDSNLPSRQWAMGSRLSPVSSFWPCSTRSWPPRQCCLSCWCSSISQCSSIHRRWSFSCQACCSFSSWIWPMVRVSFKYQN